LSNWLPFYWSGYSQSTRYTYIIEDLQDIDNVWKEFRSNIRQEIRKATKSIVINQKEDFDALKYCIKSTYDRQEKTGFDFRTLERIFITCNELNCGKIFLAKNKEDDICGAIYLVWDEKSAYYIAGGSPKEVRTSGAMPLLLWEAIKFSSSVTQQFNFEGSMIQSIERFFRGFGGRQVPYLEIKNTDSIFISLYENLFNK
jgi:lipid II:glycine glycyltransferase (peptidoglycan interpeptide bridge formation enzyme)